MAASLSRAIIGSGPSFVVLVDLIVVTNDGEVVVTNDGNVVVVPF